MLFLQLKQIEEATQILSQLENEKQGLTIILEPYSCKSSKKQKKKYKNFTDDTYIINTLDLSFSDYTFESKKSEDFQKTEMYKSKKMVNEFLTIANVPMSDETTDLLFVIIDKAIDFKHCKVYSYDMRDGPFEECSLFFCLIFFNKKKKRIMLFSAMLEK